MSGPVADRLVVLAASNGEIGLPAIARAARGAFAGRFELLAAVGHGRSYGVPAGFLGAKRPGISRCPLWEDLAAAPPAPTHAILTDIGNDLLYGTAPDVVLGWVEACLDRLQAVDARVVVTGLPLKNLPTLGYARYRFFRTLFVPKCRLSLDALAARAVEVDDALSGVCDARGVRKIDPPRAWYALDPIHFRRDALGRVWARLLASATRARVRSKTSALMLRERARLRGFHARPNAPRTLPGARREVALGDGSIVALY
ncbi:hypothetical protein Pla175_12310 [Pirellulimonas nuda]|uniref:SGNH hydrolase-type esterase domain-containing protein n=1 Tax=Pirellulimonas nuda TaxID=2528009 RepID=A0A518D8T7_9BACT|nr:hypothetical protein [Pirellulimonas nuda]QDU87864.1 hypothetical protein Pla175_12310 [Pirellulimonas nuda]